MLSIAPTSKVRFVHAAALVAAALTFLPSATAEAQDVVRPSTRPWWFAGGLGPSIFVTTDRGSRGGFTQFMLTQEIGGHFSGDGEGPALGAHLSESFGSGFFRFTVGPRFWYDIQVASNLGVYVTPDAQLGYTFFSGRVFSSHAVNLQAGCAARVVLGDRGMVFMRPVSFDFNFNDNGMVLTYNLIMGGGVTW